MRIFIAKGLAALLLLTTIIACENDSRVITVQSELKRTALLNVWTIHDFQVAGNNETEAFRCFKFIFDEGGSLLAQSDAHMYEGTWSIDHTGSTNSDMQPEDVRLVLNFDLINEFEKFNRTWQLQTFGTDRMAFVAPGIANSDTLVFSTAPTGAACDEGQSGQLSSIMEDEQWQVVWMEYDGRDTTAAFSSYRFNFKADQAVEINDGGTTYTGAWSLGGTGSTTDDLEVMFEFDLSSPFLIFNDDWDVVSYTDTTIWINDISGGGGTNDIRFEQL